jgi:hypothetical protein
MSGLVVSSALDTRKLFLGKFESASETRDAFYVVAAAPGLEAFGEAFGGAGVGVAGGADLDGGGSGEHEFDGVFWGDDSAEADDGNADGL